MGSPESSAGSDWLLLCRQAEAGGAGGLASDRLLALGDCLGAIVQERLSAASASPPDSGAGRGFAPRCQSLTI